MLRCKVVERDCRIAHARGERGADQALDIRKRNVFVVLTGCGFRGRREQRRWQTLRLLHAGGKRDSAYATTLLIVLPSGADEIAAHNGYDWQCFQSTHNHGASAELHTLIRVLDDALECYVR